MAEAVVEAIVGEAPPRRAGRARAPARRSPTWCRPSCPGRRTVVATATKALQDQLAGKDLPFLAGAPRPAVHLRGPQGPVQLPVPPAAATRPWTARSSSRSARAWTGGQAVDGGPPGAGRLGRDDADRRPGRAGQGAAEPRLGRGQRRARRVPRRRQVPAGRGLLRRGRPPRGRRGRRHRGQHPPLRHPPRRGRRVLPEHDLVVFDEAHQLEDIVSATCGARADGRPVHRPGPVVGGIIADDGAEATACDGAGRPSGPGVWPPLVGTRLRRALSDDLATVLAAVRDPARARRSSALRKIDSDAARREGPRGNGP